MRVVQHGAKELKVADKATREELLKNLSKKYRKLVKGRFEFTDAQGGEFSFNYKFLPEDLYLTYHIVHGEETELPMGVVKHLNNTYKKIRMFDPNIDKYGPSRGVPSTYERVSRVKFIPTEFILDD